MTFYFYDLETSGFNSREARIMQFAGQRTDMDLHPIGKPHNIVIKLTPDVLPDPGAVLITGITPQQTWRDGVTEAEFLNLFFEEIVAPDTIFVGYNTIRFDDEFMRNILYRNLHEPYEWQWKNNSSRWDLLDVIRMTRALRPEGIEWPFDSGGSASNRLELLTKSNKLNHTDAHDALSDVLATIELAKLIKNKQPKIFDFLLGIRTKQIVTNFINENEMFVYTSGRYSSRYEKTAVVCKLMDHPKKQGILVYDVRYNPSEYINLNPAQLAELWRTKKENGDPGLPIKTLQYNRCPAVAPLGVLDKDSLDRLNISLKESKKNFNILRKSQKFSDLLLKAIEILDKKQAELLSSNKEAESKLYDNFISKNDKELFDYFHKSEPAFLMDFVDKFDDSRLRELVPRYKARNYPSKLTDQERGEWESYCSNKLLGGGEHSKLADYFKQLDEISKQSGITTDQSFLLQELQLYGQSLLPSAH